MALGHTSLGMQADREQVLGCREAEWYGAPIRLGRAEELPRRGAGCGAGKGLGPGRSYASAFSYASAELRSYPDVVLAAVQANGRALQYA